MGQQWEGLGEWGTAPWQSEMCSRPGRIAVDPSPPQHVAVGLAWHPGLGLPQQGSPGLLGLLCAQLRGRMSTCSLAGVSGSPLVFLGHLGRVCSHTCTHTCTHGLIESQSH